MQNQRKHGKFLLICGFGPLLPLITIQIRIMFESSETHGIEYESESTSTSKSLISEESLHSNDQISKHQGAIDEKLKFYTAECKRYFLEKLHFVQQLIAEKFDCCYLQDFLIGSLQCQIMFDTFQKIHLTPITVVNLKNNHLEPFCCHSMASFIELSTTLKDINLSGCKIGDKGMEILSAAFATSISLVSINLSNNQITDDGGEILVSFLLRNYVCRDLNVSWNMLGYKTAVVVGEVLKENEILEKLDISHNRLYEQFAAIEVMKGLMENESLEYLDMSWNGISGEQFGKILSKSLKAAKLIVFKLEHNNLTAFEFKKLALGIKYSQTIEEVYVGGNFFTVDDDENLVKVFKTESPIKLLSFGDSFHLSRDAYKIYQAAKQIRPEIRVIYQNVLYPNPPIEVSMLDIFADRAKALAMQPKILKFQRDMGIFMARLLEVESSFIPRVDFLTILQSFNANLDVELVNQYIDECMATVDGKRLVNIHLMANHYLNRHPLAKKIKEAKQA